MDASVTVTVHSGAADGGISGPHTGGALAPPEAPAAATVAAGGPPAQHPDAFAVRTSYLPGDGEAAMESSVDPLLAGLLLARERLAYHQARVATVTTTTTTTTAAARRASAEYHSGAVTSLVHVPAGPQPPPPLRPDVVDAYAAAQDAAQARAASASPQPQPLSSDRLLPVTGEQDAAEVGGGAGTPRHGKGKSTAHRRHGQSARRRSTSQPHRHRSLSRREEAHAARMAVALNPTFILPMHEQHRTAAAGAAQERRDSDEAAAAARDEHDGHGKKQKRRGGSVSGATASIRVHPSPSTPTAVAADGSAAGTSLEPPQRSRRRRGPSHRVHDAEGRNEEATGASAPPAAAASGGEGDIGEAAAERASDASHPDYDYDPDDADAGEALAEKVRLLRQQADDAAAGGHGRGLSVAALVRPAERFHRGPAPAWVLAFSDALLFDTHALDDAVRRAEEESGMGGVVQLPVDAVVLRLRSDVARVRRLWDALVRDTCSAAATPSPLHTLRTVLFGSAYSSRAEVYDPVEPVLQSPATARGDVGAATGDEEGLVVVGVNCKHETAASVDANKRSTREAASPITGALAATTTPSALPASPAAITASKPTGPSPLLLDRSVEARDLRRPLLAQTIPVWRRRGAAVQLVGELLEHLQDRLCAFEGQLADPALGALMDLIGAPDSSGVDGRVESTYPPALERALRTTVTNTLLSDVFASAWTALPNRALRISEALRRRHTPTVHAEYFTCTDVRPVYDYTVLQSSRRAADSSAAGLLLSAAATGAAGAASAAGHTGEASGGHGSGTAGNAGVDARKSYSVHVDYVRFQPSLEHIHGTSVLDGGAAAAAAATSSATNSDSGLRGAGSGSRRPSMPTATSDDPLSSLLLGSYANVFFTRDPSRAGGGVAAAGGPENSTSASSPADAVRGQSSEQGTSQHASSSAAATASAWQQQQQQSRGMSNTAAALLLALSASTAQHSLVAFSPEAYLTSVLLQYYEQYRLLQLNLLPGLKNRFFYLEQVTQLQRQPKRDTDLEQLQARLEALAATAADVERGCLHVMVLLWNSVLLLRRRARSAAPPAAAPNVFGSDIELHEMQSVVPHHGGGASQGSGEGGSDEDPPIIVVPAASPATAGRAARHSTHPQRHSHQHAPQQQQQGSGDGTSTRAEVRAHPPVFTAEAPQSPAGTLDAAAAAAVHRVDKSVTYGDRVEGRGREDGTPPQVPGALPAHQHPRRDSVYSPAATAAATPSASASPLLAPLLGVSVSGDASGHGGLRGGVNDVHAAAAAAAEAARQWHDVDAAAPLAPQQSLPQQQPQPPRRFRFYLRRYGTTQETPYTVGDELLNYAAEVEGADVLAPARGPGAPSMDADELMYFQLVVFARSHAAMVPQYVGCTTPRPMTAAKVVFFNETFEVRALHEPAELLLHLIPVTAGPAKHTVASTVRLRPTLTRTYTLLPLQPPTAFVFHGRLFTQHSRHVGVGVGGGGAAAAARTAASVHGVLAVSTTWTSSHGLTIPQVERLFLGGPDGTRGVADPLDPQYLPLLRMLRSYYTEVEAAAAGADGQGGGIGRRAGGGGRHGRGRHGRHSERPRSHGRSNTAPPASAADRARAYEQQHPPTSDAEDGASTTTIRAGVSHGRRGRDAHGETGSQGSAGLGFRTASTLAHMRLRRQASNLGLPPQQQRGGAGLMRVGSSARLLGPQNQQQYRRRASLDAATAAVVAAAGGARDAGGVRGMRRMITAGGISAGGLAGDAALVSNVGLGGGTAGGGGGVGGGLVVSHELFALQEVLVRLPSERLRHLHRRWMIRTNRIKAADEVEARLFARPMPLDDEDAYQLQKAMRRAVAKEEVERVKDYGAAAGALFNVDHYYRAPSAVSGLALSPLPRETKLKLWRERQRRLLLTLKAKRRVTDAERLEAVVRVPKLAIKLVFDFAPRGQLNPHRKERPKTEDIDRAVLARRHDSRIVIHIMKAHNLPLRADGTPLEPFVQASFVSEAAYTRSEVGSNPSWFQSLELPFQPLDFEEDTLGMIDDDIILSLYDKVEVKMAPSAVTTAVVAHETHYRTERRFVGTLHIPFYSLHQASQARMEGVYPLRMPRWVLGYNTTLPSADGTGDGGASPNPDVFAGRGAVEMRSGNFDANRGPNPFFHSSRTDRHEGGDTRSLQSSEPSQQRGTPDATATPAPVVLAPTTNRTSSESQTVEPTVQLYLSLWPPLQREPAPELSRDELARKVGELNVSPQLRYLHQVALKWQKVAARKVKSIGSINAQASARQVEPFVLCSTGDLVLVCRYLLPRGGPPPPSVRTVYEAIRYVSLLPFVADMLSWGEKDVWSTNAELLASRSGDYEELALLLVHFLRHLAPNRPTYAVLGSGTIYQQTIMVLHAFDDGEWMLIDPRSGWTVSAGKPYGTVLRDVYMVVSHDQIWANVQLSGLPHRMTWDLTNPAHWLPCFDAVRDARIAVCTPHLFPIQREVLNFLPADAVKSREIELELRSCLKKALLTWRNSCPPAYHRGVEVILRELLEAAEAERCLCGSARRTDVTASAAARLSEYFGENLMGVNASPAVGAAETDDSVAAAARHQQQQQRHRRGGRRSHSRRGRGEGGDGADADATVDGGGGTSAMERSGLNITATPAMTLTSAVSPLRLIGSPVVGSYNPSDPQFQELLHQVFECAVHEVGTSEVSFAVGTYVKSYTGDVCAVWIFLVAICRG